MEENNFLNKEAEQVSNQVWHLFNSLRGKLDIEEMHFVLLILSAYRDGLLSNLHYDSNDNLNFDLIKAIKKSEKYNNIIEIYEPIIISIPAEHFEEFLKNLFQINHGKLRECFSEIFDLILYKLSNSQGKKSGEFIQPYEISRFIMNLAVLSKNANVYNPFAGLASFSVFLRQDQHYYGQEYNYKTWALGMLRLLAYKKYNQINYVIDDSIKNWPKNKKFDLIVANPPFNLKIDNIGNTAENFLIENGINSLTKDGELICVLPIGFLFRGGKDQRLREELVNKQLIDTIISLPPGLLKHTGIPICIVVFKNTQKTNGKIRLVNADDFIVNHVQKDKRFDDVKLLKLLKGNEDNEFVKHISIEDIRDSDYNLNVHRYFSSEVLGTTLVPGIGEHLRGTTAEKGIIGKIIKIRDLKDNAVDITLNLNSVETKEISLIGFRKIDESCLLLAIRWKTLKPTFFKYEGEPIYISTDIIAIRIDETIININFLINELYSDYVKEQINRYRNTGTIPLIRRNDLFNIKIQLPSLEQQNKKYYSVVNEYIKSILSDSNTTYSENKIDIEDENSFLRHQIAGSLKNVRGAIKFVHKILEEKVKPQLPGLYDYKASDELETTLQTYLNIIDRDLISINKSVNRAGDKIELMDLNIENFDLLEFIKDYAESLSIRSNNFYSIILNLDENAITEYGMSAIHIDGDKELLRKMFDNIIENAEKHAFTYGINNKNQNKISFDLIYNFEDFEVQLDICNTGKPLPESMTHESMIRKGSSSGANSGDGVGIWFVNEVMKLHKGHFGYTDETGPEGIDGEYVTSIELTFPIIPAI